MELTGRLPPPSTQVCHGRLLSNSRNQTLTVLLHRQDCALLRRSQSYLLRRKAAGRLDLRNPPLTDPDRKRRAAPLPICTTSLCLILADADFASLHSVQFYDAVIDGARYEQVARPYEAPGTSRQHLRARLGRWLEVEVA
jgi:hypothetical protein